MLLRDVQTRLEKAGKPITRRNLNKHVSSGTLKATLVEGVLPAFHVTEEDYQAFEKLWLSDAIKPGRKPSKKDKQPAKEPRKSKKSKQPLKEPRGRGRPPAQTIHPIYEYPMYLIVTDGLLSFREWKQKNPGKNCCSLDLETLKKFEGDRTQCYLVYHRDYQRNSLWGSPELEALEQECMEEETSVV